MMQYKNFLYVFSEKDSDYLSEHGFIRVGKRDSAGIYVFILQKELLTEDVCGYLRKAGYATTNNLSFLECELGAATLATC